MQDGQADEEGALQQTCLLILFNMSTASKSSDKEQQQDILLCCPFGAWRRGWSIPWLLRGWLAHIVLLRGCFAQDQNSSGNIPVLDADR